MPRFAVELCFTQPRKGRLCAAGKTVEGQPEVGMTAEIEGHMQRAKADVIAVEPLTLKSGREVEVLVFELATAPWRPFFLDGSTLVLDPGDDHDPLVPPWDR